MSNTVPPPEDDILAALEKTARTGQAECRLCGHVVEGESFGDILDALADHGDEHHEWRGPGEGWSA